MTAARLMADPGAEPPAVTPASTFRDVLIVAVEARTWGRANAAQVRALQSHIRDVQAAKSRCTVG